MEEKILDFYDRGEWKHVPDWIVDGDVDKQLEEAGFEMIDQFGEALAMYVSRDGRWCATLESPLWWRLIMVADFPSMVMLVKELSPWVAASMVGEQMGIIEEFRDLLIGTRRTVGPLAECLSQRRQQERDDIAADRARRKAKKS